MSDLSAVNFLRDQEPRVIAGLLASAMGQQKVSTLDLLLEAGFFNITKGDRFFGLERFHNRENPEFASIMGILNDSRATPRLKDAISGEPFAEGAFQHVLGIGLKRGIRDFTHQLLDTFITQMNGQIAGASSPSEEAESKRSFEGTASAFLAVGCATNDADLVRKTLEAHPGWDEKGLSSRNHWVSTKLLNKNQDGPERMIHPAAIAIAFGSMDALDVFVEHGWRPTRAVLIEPSLTKDGQAGGYPAFNAMLSVKERRDIFELLDSDSAIQIPPTMAARLVELMKGPDGIIEQHDSLRRWKDTLLSKAADPTVSPMFPALIAAGLYDRENDCRSNFIKAVGTGATDVIEHLAAKVDWSSFDFAENPAAIALSDWSGWNSWPDRMTTAAHRVFDLCEQNDRTDLITVPESAIDPDPSNKRPHLPLIEAVQNGATHLMLRCLDLGADPRQKDAGGQSALKMAEEAQREDLVSLIRSAQARREASLALAELDISPSHAQP